MTSEIEELYRTMARIRAFERRVAKHFREGDIHGFVHVSVGQEAVAAGACAALAPDDAITTTHRGHGHCIAKGADVTAMMAELFGRADGLCRGQGGSMHIADPSLGIMGANGIVGAGIPLAAGVAWAARARGEERVSVAFFGEGAVHAGAFHEGVTLAVAWDLPLILVCENNRYAEFTPSSAWRGPSLLDRARGYGMPAIAVDGSDVLAVREAMRGCVEEVRAGRGPIFLEAETYRLHGHFEGDAEAYRSKEEVERWRERDPLLVARERHGVAADTAGRLEAEAEAELDAAVAAALVAPYPEPEMLREAVHA